MYALVDHRISDASLRSLKAYGHTPILMPSAEYLSNAVSSHTDMLLFIGFERLFCHAHYYEKNKKLIDELILISNLKLILSTEFTNDKYPYDVLFNACVVGRRLICNEKTVSKLIIEAAHEGNYEIINVPQGYTKCSICPISDNSIITSDKKISERCVHYGLNVLLISEGNISLPPFDHGFIGGASGYYNKTIYFCGSLDTHPDGEKIKSFCIQNGAKAIELTNCKLQDIGTIFFI